MIVTPFLLRRNLIPDNNLYLYDLSDDKLNDILNLSEDDLHYYIHSLISRFYKDVDTDTYIKLKNAYKGSFVLEKLYRANSILINNYTAIYTKTGLVRELVNDLYSLDAEKVAIH